MTVAVWISPQMQFGGLRPGEGRQGAMRQALTQAIRVHLFGERPSDYRDTLASFAAAIAEGVTFPKDRDGAQALWQELMTPIVGSQQGSSKTPRDAQCQEPGAASLTASGNVSLDVPEPVEGAFGLSIQALCAALAESWVGSEPSVDLDNDEDSDANAGDVPRWSEGRASYSRVVQGLADLLRQVLWRWLRDRRQAGASPAGDLRLVASALLDALLGSLDEWFALESQGAHATDDGPRSVREIVLRRPELAVHIHRLLENLPFQFTVHPLKEPVAYRLGDPGPAEDADTDYTCIELVGYRRTNAFLRRLHGAATLEAHRAPALLRYIEAVNLQQAVPWRLNREVFHFAKRLVASTSEGDTPATDTDGDLDSQRGTHGERASSEQERFSKAIEQYREIFSSPIARPVFDELAVDGPDGRPPTFYLAWKADYRGRIYAETPWLTPQGGDLQRALFEVTSGRPLDDAGVRALRRHGANLVKRGRLLDDLGISGSGRQVLTLAERERWVVEHEQEILASAAEPLAEPFWREVASKPMQFLAFCFAYRQWQQDPHAPIHLPVQIDGTCNGLQHIAALTGDAALALSVNVLPAPNGLPGDIYSELATAAAEHLGSLPDPSPEQDRAFGVRVADQWLAGLPASREWLNRGTAKKVVMTIPYGASPGAQARHVLDAIARDFESAWATDAPPLEMLDDLVAWKEADDGRRAFVARCTRRLLEPPADVAFSRREDLETLVARQEWERKRTLAAYVGLCIVEHLRDALAERYPAVNAFSDWLKDTARVCQGLPLLWQTPLGFPICQDKFKLHGTSATARLGAKRVRVDITQLGEVVWPAKQRDALLPNLIHGLDATHLALTLLQAHEDGVTDVGSIHDCLLCHPNDASALGHAVRRTFVQMYAPGRLGLPDPLIRWRDWMALIMELRLVPRRLELLGAMTHAGEQAEQDLLHDARRGESAAVQALDVLERIRRRDPSERYLLRRVLEYAVDHGGEVTAPKKPPVMPSPPGEGGFPWGNGALSEYFFS